MSQGSGYYATNSTVSMSASTNFGYSFNGWSGDCSGTGTCSVTMSQNRSVSTSFTGWYFSNAPTSVNPASGDSYIYGNIAPSGSYSFAPYPGWPNTIYAGYCHVDGDGLPDIVLGVSAGGGPHVQILSVKGGGSICTRASYFADGTGAYTGGVQVVACHGNGCITVQFGNGSQSYQCPALSNC